MSQIVVRPGGASGTRDHCNAVAHTISEMPPTNEGTLEIQSSEKSLNVIDNEKAM